MAAAASSAAPYLPARRTLPALREAAGGCRGCPLYRHATQTVFGSGSPLARLMLVGEQPGAAEDDAGAPFVGPAGRLLDQALAAAGIPREQIYLTNAVKHFKWVLRGKRRLHQKPAVAEIQACLPWLQAEYEALNAPVVICLGTTAARAVCGRPITLKRQRGRVFASALAPATLVTMHPAAVLRRREAAERHAGLQELADDLRLGAGRI